MVKIKKYSTEQLNMVKSKTYCDVGWQNTFVIILALLSFSFPTIYLVYREKYSDKFKAPRNVDSIVVRNTLMSDKGSLAGDSNPDGPELAEDTLIKFANKSLEDNPHLSNTAIRSVPLSLRERANIAFRNHPSHFLEKSLPIENHMLALSKSPNCRDKPVFMTMARVSSDLYWQLIENFYHTMFVFNHLDCAMMVCISDPGCMERCDAQGFPCIDYRYKDPDAVTFEQVAAVKIYHVSEALKLGVHILLLDLDVGFLRDPMLLFEGFLKNPREQVRAQMDVGTSMYPFTLKWYSFPRPNFGVYLIKSHEQSIKVFRRAWKEYQKVKFKDQVALDQNVVTGAMKWARWRWGYNFSYFDLGYMLHTYPRPIHFDKRVLLLDKLEFHWKKGIYFELGGKAAKSELGAAIAVHATCYEKSTKLMALKAANAFWTLDYYDPMRRTITKPLMVHSLTQLRTEIHALAQLAMLTNRSLILPNILIGAGTNIPQAISLQTTRKGKKLSRHKMDALVLLNMSHAPEYRGEFYWPAFRTALNDIHGLEVVEPAYYWRLLTDFQMSVPEPHIVRFDLDSAAKMARVRSKSQPIKDDALFFGLVQKVLEADEQQRIVLDLRTEVVGPWGPPDLAMWAADSIGDWGWGEMPIPKSSYVEVPHPKKSVISEEIAKRLLMCKTFLYRPVGNRTCFEKCM